MLINIAQISTNNPLWVNLNTCLFCYFFQIGIQLSKQNKRPYVNGKLPKTPWEEFL
jgi:hypothetical protein